MEPIVTKGTSFLFGPVLKIEATDEATSADTAATAIPSVKPKPKKKKSTPHQDYLDGLWGDDDDRMTLLSETAINGGVCGQQFTKLIAPQGNMKYPRLIVLDPQIIRIVTAPDDCSLHLAYILEYPGGDDWQKKQIITRVDPHNDVSTVGDSDIADSWTITNYVRRVNAGSTTQNTWMQQGDPIDWPYPFAPIFTNKNLPNPNESWGVPDLTQDLINENKVLNFLFSNLARIIKYHGHPKTVATGVQAQDITMTVDGVLCLPDETSKIDILKAMENFSGILSVIGSVMSNIDEQSRVPAVALGRVADLPRGNISGVALQLLFQPLIEKTIQKQRLYGQMIRQVSRAALVIGGLIDVSEYEDYSIDLHWQNLLPVDDLAAAQTAAILKTLGVSDATILQQLGYDPDA
ncbi:MAG: phage portal protein, partial [Acidimicrobiales bacterium]